MIQAVARALNPGCKADSVPILEGNQGIGKSTALRILHSTQWFGDALPPMGSKDASDYIRGKWGIELAELSFQQKAEVEAQKALFQDKKKDSGLHMVERKSCIKKMRLLGNNK